VVDCAGLCCHTLAGRQAVHGDRQARQDLGGGLRACTTAAASPLNQCNGVTQRQRREQRELVCVLCGGGSSGGGVAWRRGAAGNCTMGGEVQCVPEAEWSGADVASLVLHYTQAPCIPVATLICGILSHSVCRHCLWLWLGSVGLH
jgi:hypothetical protein